MELLIKFDIKKIQYMNMFERTCNVKAKTCFYYDKTVVFVVPRPLVAKAIGRGAMNVRVLASRLNRDIKIIAMPSTRADIGSFIGVVISPNRFTRLSLEQDKLIIYSAPRTKALLIGRGKLRLQQLSSALEQFFGIKEVQIR
jgi:transcription antitermination factor NusA-like protein